jgi:DNA replication protein DnaC
MAMGTEKTQFIDASIGRRYVDCDFANYKTSTPEQKAAVAKCREYVRDFRTNLERGFSLVLIGPKGTGKDHLMVAVVKRIAMGFDIPGKVVYRDGLTMFSEFRDAIRTNVSEDTIVERYTRPRLLAVSDPVPPIGTLSEYEQRIWLRIVDGRYRNCLPIAATVNVQSRSELDGRMGPQAADRLCDSAVVVKCNWKSYRSKGDKE